MADTRPAPHAATVLAAHPEQDGALAWLLSLDHKRVALMQLAGVAAALGVALLLGLILRAEHVSPTRDVTSGLGYARLFTLHGTVMLFAFALPGIPATLGSFVLPLQLGARNVAFPRLHLASFHLWLLGGLLLLVSVSHGAAHGGWTLYPPYSLTDAGAVAPHALAMIALAVSACLRAIVLIVTIHTQRSLGTPWRRLSSFAWSIYAYSCVVVVAAPVLVLSLILLLLERWLGVGFFDAALGGDPLLYEAFFWFAAHGLLIAPMLPALGVIAEVFAAFTAPATRAPRPGGAALAALGVLSFLGWGVHLSAGGHSIVLASVFSLMALLSAVPAAMLVRSWLGALRGATLRLESPLLFALTFVSMFVVAGLSGVFLAVLGTGVHLHGTAFVTAHAHYMLAGALLAAFLAGLHYWWAKLTGRRFGERTARWAAALTLVGMHLAFFPGLVAGSRGLPRRLDAYPVEFALLEQLAAVGALLLASGMVLVGYNLLRSLTAAADAPANPWNLASAEWAYASLPIAHQTPAAPEATPNAEARR